jgi:hypothetical protein
MGEMRWVGIDEAGYGPNLGPLVMTAVIAEGRNGTDEADPQEWAPPPDLWCDLAAAVDRAGGDPARFWVDDSKAILKGGKGRDRLEATCLAVLDAAGIPLPRDAHALLQAVGARGPEETELVRWLEGSSSCSCWTAGCALESMGDRLASRPMEPADGSWRIVAVRSVVLGPERFNHRLGRMDSKAAVHFSAFRELLAEAWDLAEDGRPTRVQSDKHGGRHYYLGPLIDAFPDTWIDRGPEGPDLSRYTIRANGRSLCLCLSPRADGSDGLVALASVVSKALREVWMDAFNGFWTSRLPGLRPTAGYPVDAERFRRAIEDLARDQDLHPDLWWRRK